VNNLKQQQQLKPTKKLVGFDIEIHRNYKFWGLSYKAIRLDKSYSGGSILIIKKL